MTPRTRKGRPTGSGALQQPVPFSITHSKLGNLTGAMSQAAYRTLTALLDRADSAGNVATNRHLLAAMTGMALGKHTEALRELIDRLGFVQLIKPAIAGQNTEYRVLVKKTKKRGDRQFLEYFAGAEPESVSFDNRYGAMLYIEVPGATEAEAHLRLKNLMKLSPDLEAAKVVNVEQLSTDKKAG